MKKILFCAVICVSSLTCVCSHTDVVMEKPEEVVVSVDNHQQNEKSTNKDDSYDVDDLPNEITHATCGDILSDDKDEDGDLLDEFATEDLSDKSDVSRTKKFLIKCKIAWMLFAFKCKIFAEKCKDTVAQWFAKKDS